MKSHFAYYERSVVNTNNLYVVDEKSDMKDYDPDDNVQDEMDETDSEESKLAKKENEKTLLQIPVELLPCPQDTKTVTDRTYTYPSQNEAKDYRNLIQTSLSTRVVANLTVFLLSLLFLVE